MIGGKRTINGGGGDGFLHGIWSNSESWHRIWELGTMEIIPCFISGEMTGKLWSGHDACFDVDEKDSHDLHIYWGQRFMFFFFFLEGVGIT